MNTVDFKLQRDAYGQLLFTTDTGNVHTGVVPVRAFPIDNPEQGISLLSTEGHELAWIEHLNSLPAEARRLLSETLAAREFMPQILQLVQVSSFATPSTWLVVTDRGPTSLILKGEEDIRRLSSSMLLIGDSHGIQFIIRDLQKLDRSSRKLLDRFL
jgi:Domain of unknown function (DUF1854)